MKAVDELAEQYCLDRRLVEFEQVSTGFLPVSKPTNKPLKAYFDAFKAGYEAATLNHIVDINKKDQE